MSHVSGLWLAPLRGVTVRTFRSVFGAAIREAGLKPQSIAFRGGTDGSALSQRGLPCPNLSAGYENAHGRFEYVPIPSMEKNVEILLHLAALFGSLQDG